MTGERKTRKASVGTQGTRMLITAAAVTATIGGWAWFAGNDTQTTVNVAPQSTNTPQLVVPPTTGEQFAGALDLSPIPTIIPTPSGGVANAPAAEPQTMSQSQQPAIIAQPTLVTPAPVTTTRSSR